ncbi:16S rRNA (cytosine(967)-C(5))-methyltransferase RsmB [Rubritalea spongiae]|uniref:16S rRNA (cytosine(967)-C(5))-methyltransferase n=1 Tax=Rubritalea spongiae TaxID=430797 RepID=A0ABW5E3U9_9BACT
MTTNVRRIASEALEEWEEGHIYAESLVDNAARAFNLSREDRNLLNALIIGCIRNKSLLDFWIGQLREGEIDLQVRCHLRVGLFQLLIMGLPDHAAVNETVNSARKGIRGLINALLRRTIREREELQAMVEELPLPIRYSHPEWLVDRWTEQYGEQATLQLLQWNQQPSQTTFRINPLKPETLERVTNSEKATPLADHPEFYSSNGLPPREWIDEGLIYIQDPATMHAVNILSPKAGEHVLDACAAPGGKSTQIAALMENKGSLLCTDSNAKRLPRLLRNLGRLGIEIAETEAFDWSHTAPEKWHNSFDAILLDVPCSNTGVLRKRVDARWRMTPESISEVASLQKSILGNAAKCIKAGGRLVYSTCSIDKEENSELIQNFLQSHPELELAAEEIIHPASHKTDGAYAALLVKKS